MDRFSIDSKKWPAGITVASLLDARRYSNPSRATCHVCNQPVMSMMWDKDAPDDDCDPHRCMAIMSRTMMPSPMHQTTELVEVRTHKTIPVRGIGVFVRPGHTVPPGLVLGVCGGELLPTAEFLARKDKGRFWFPPHPDMPFCIKMSPADGWIYFINTHCMPNVEVAPVLVGKLWLLIMRTIRPIHQNEEVTVNYGPPFFELSRKWCHCPAAPVPHVPSDRRSANKRWEKRQMPVDQPY